MKVTEKEAAQLWCPHVRHQEGMDDHPSNRSGTQGDGITNYQWNKCVGSLCMMWRWHGTYPPLPMMLSENLSPKGPKKPDEVGPYWKWHPEHEGDPGCWEEPLEEACARAKGFCGLTSEGSHGHE